MAEIATNHDLYLAVEQLTVQYREHPRPLEEYLRALWGVAYRYGENEAFAPDEFFELLAEAFTAEPEPFGENWGDFYDFDDEFNLTDFTGVETRLARQIIDLREMAAAGQLDNEMRYFGIDSPRGSPWCNFDPLTFLECGMAGTFGGRDGEGVPLGDIPRWRFRNFLGAGQWYE